VGDIIDSAVILLVVIINATVGFLQEHRAEKAMEKLKGLISSEAVVIREGQKMKLPARLVASVILLSERLMVRFYK